MTIEELNKLEEKINNMVNGLKLLKDENKKLKDEIVELKKEASFSTQERQQVKQKVTTLIRLLDSIEQADK